MATAMSLVAIAERSEGLVPLRRWSPADLSEEGIRSRVRRRKLERLGPRLYRVPGSVRSWRQRILSAVEAAGPGAAVSHRSAAALWGLPGFSEDVIEVSRPRQAHHPGLIGTVHESRQLPGSHTRVVDGVRVTSVARTLFDLCGSREVHWLRAERAMANALSRRLVTWPELALMGVQMCRRGRRGSARFRKLIEKLGMNGHLPTDSELEDLLLTALREAGLPLPELGDEDGPIGRVDGYYRKANVVLEADSERHHSSWLDRESDRERDARLVAAGHRVIRVTWRQLNSRGAIFTRAVARALEIETPT
jgi:hypothetical protein